MIGYIKKHRELFILLLLLLILVIIPLSFLRLPSGHDYKYHMGRIYQISENIRHGKWFAPIYYEQLSGCGYASPVFYGDVFLHLPGALVTLGMSVEASLRIYIMLCLTATALVTYFCALKLTSEKLPALVTSVLYTFSSYLAIDFITRVALGEVQAFIFLPIAFTGLMSILTGDAKHWLLLPTGLCGVLISHTLSAACLAFFFLVIALFYIPELIKNKKRIALIALSAGIFFALSAFYVFPMLEQLSFGTLRLNDGTADTIWGTLARRAMPLYKTISDFNLTTANVDTQRNRTRDPAFRRCTHISPHKKGQGQRQSRALLDSCGHCPFRLVNTVPVERSPEHTRQASVPVATPYVRDVFRCLRRGLYFEIADKKAARSGLCRVPCRLFGVQLLRDRSTQAENHDK